MNVAAEANLLLASLRVAAGWSAEPLDFAAVDPGRFLDVVDEQRLAPWLARRADRLPGLPADLRAELDALYYREARDAGARWLDLRDLRGALHGGPPALLLKGGALLADFYTELAERPMWDVDLLLADEAAARDATARLAAIGFRPVRGDQAHHHTPALRRPGGDLAVELHLDLHTPSPGEAFRAALWAQARRAPAGWAPLLVPDRPALVAHQALHAFSDVVDSPLIRNLFEIAQLVRTFDAAQVERLRQIAAGTPFAPTLARALALAARWFGSPALLGTPDPGWPERLADWRIGQQGHDQRGERLARHLARVAGEKLKHGWAADSLLLPAAVTAEAAGRALAARLGRAPASTRRPAPQWESVEVAGHLLVCDAQSGVVHLLQPAAAAVWRDPARWTAPADRAAVAALAAAGLLPSRAGPAKEIA